jgi:PIN domain nuclease of toxin-antitoxin system
VRFLLDTCTFLWLVAGDDALSESARASVVNPDNDVYLSAVSAWEIAVKHGLGRLPLPESPDRFVPIQRERHAVAPLALDEKSVLLLPKLPPLHRDPFDRALICQAIQHELTVLTPDRQITQYAVRTAW